MRQFPKMSTVPTSAPIRLHRT